MYLKNARKCFVIIKHFLLLTFLLALTTVARADDFLSVKAKIKLNPKENHGAYHGAYIEVSPSLQGYKSEQRERLERSMVEFMPFLAKPDFYPTQISSDFRLERDPNNPFGLILTDSLYPRNINEWVNGILAGCFNRYWQSLSRVDQSQFEPIFSVQPKWRVDVKSESNKFSKYLENNYEHCADIQNWRVGLPDFIHMKMTSYFTSKRNRLPFTPEDLPVAKFFDDIHTAQLGNGEQTISNQRVQSLKKWIENVKQSALFLTKRKMSIKKSFAWLKKAGKLSFTQFSVSLVRENYNRTQRLHSRRIAVFVDSIASVCLIKENFSQDALSSPVDWVVSAEKCPFDIDKPEKGYFELVFKLKSGIFKFVLPLIQVQEEAKKSDLSSN